MPARERTAAQCLEEGLAFDAGGQEAKAIPLHRRAIALAHFDARQVPLAMRQLGDALLREPKQPELAKY